MNEFTATCGLKPLGFTEKLKFSDLRGFVFTNVLPVVLNLVSPIGELLTHVVQKLRFEGNYVTRTSNLNF